MASVLSGDREHIDIFEHVFRERDGDRFVCDSGAHDWQSTGGRKCAHGNEECSSQIVYRCFICGEWDYGDAGGPGYAGCVAYCPHFTGGRTPHTRQEAKKSLAITKLTGPKIERYKCPFAGQIQFCPLYVESHNTRGLGCITDVGGKCTVEKGRHFEIMLGVLKTVDPGLIELCAFHYTKHNAKKA